MLNKPAGPPARRKTLILNLLQYLFLDHGTVDGAKFCLPEGFPTVNADRWGSDSPSASSPVQGIPMVLCHPASLRDINANAQHYQKTTLGPPTASELISYRGLRKPHLYLGEFYRTSGEISIINQEMMGKKQWLVSLPYHLNFLRYSSI